jgi:hypothetical protein
MAPVCDGAAMIHRKGEITKADLRRRYHLVLPADKLRGLMNREIVRAAAVALLGSAADVFRASRRSRLCCVLLYQASKRRCFF